MDARRSIVRFERTSIVAVAAGCAFRGLMRALPVLAVGLIAFAGLDRWLEFPSWFRRIAWLAGGAAAAALFGSGFSPVALFRLISRSENLYFESRRRKRGTAAEVDRPDELRLAVELATEEPEPGISDELKELYLARIARKFSENRARWCFPAWPWRRVTMAAFLWVAAAGTVWSLYPGHFPLGPRVLFPFGYADIAEAVDVRPGDGVVAFGDDAEITVAMKISALDRPDVYVNVQGEWTEISPENETGGVRVYALKRVVEPVEYRVRWKKDWGRRYTITPVHPVRLESFSVRIRQPDYAGGESVSQNSPELTGLPGSAVAIDVTANRPVRSAKAVFSDGSESAATTVEGRSFSFRFNLFKSGDYRFVVEAETGERLDGDERHGITILSDEPPVITLLSPDADLLVSPNEPIPLTYTVEDDYGVRRVVLAIEKDGAQPRRLEVARFSEPVGSALKTYAWDLRRSGERTGEVLRYRLEAEDANRVTGPGRDSTPWRVLEIASFEMAHEALEETLGSWREKVVDLLADVTLLKADVDATELDLGRLAAPANAVVEKSRALERALQQIVSMMEQDPLADYALWSEHRAMSENMRAMNEGAMRRAQAAVQTRNRNVASYELANVAAELERMLALSEDLSKTQRARDIVDSGDALSSLGEDLERQLRSAAERGRLSADDLQAVEEMIREAQKILSEMARQIERFPDELPEDFVNQAALKDLNVGESRDILSRIQDAVKRGDAKAALDLARSFLDAAKGMRNRLSEAHESFLNQNSAEELGNQIEAERERLNALTAEQRSVLAETQRLESKRLEAVLQEQEKILETLAQKQLAALAKAEEVVQDRSADAVVRQRLSEQLLSMREVATEFRTMRVNRAPQLLEAIVQRLLPAAVELGDAADSPAAGKMKEVGETEREILDALRRPHRTEAPRTAEERERLASLKSRQESLAKKTDELRRNLQGLSRRTASLGATLTRPLAEAKGEMDAAADSLGKGRSREAQSAEENALSNLQAAQDALSEAQSAMRRVAAEQGTGGGSGGQPRVLLRGGGSSKGGGKTGKVRLPRAEDYKAPKAFREELLESLREKYPEAYEQVIHEYFKRLTE